ncbi:MAG TPA: hypothetical protein VJB11_02555 [archaeon]|nr:hypothetical protein [archaeon]
MKSDKKYEKIFGKKIILDKDSINIGLYETPIGELLTIEYKGKIELFEKR